MDNFASRLKEFRLEKELSQERLAKETNISASAIRNWENGINEPLLGNLITLAKFFGVSLDEMAGLTD